MSQEWKLVPVVPTLEMVEALKARITATSRGGILGAGAAIAEAVKAAPVPPAGGEVGSIAGLRQLVIGPYPDPDVEDAHDEYLDGHQSQALWLLRNAARIETHVTRLQSENAALQQRLNVADQLNDDLQSDLTKARELLNQQEEFIVSAWQWLPIWLRKTYKRIAHQSAPAAKCNHSRKHHEHGGTRSRCSDCGEACGPAAKDLSIIGIVPMPPMEYDEP